MVGSLVSGSLWCQGGAVSSAGSLFIVLLSVLLSLLGPVQTSQDVWAVLLSPPGPDVTRAAAVR